MIFTLSVFCFFILGCWNFLYIYKTLKLNSFNFLQKMFSQFSYWILETFVFKKTQILWYIFEPIMSSQNRTVNSHSNSIWKKMMITRTNLKILLNLFKIKHLWNQTKIQLKIHNRLHCKSHNLLFLLFLLKEYNIHLWNCTNNSLILFCH